MGMAFGKGSCVQWERKDGVEYGDSVAHAAARPSADCRIFCYRTSIMWHGKSSRCCECWKEPYSIRKCHRAQKKVHYDDGEKSFLIKCSSGQEAWKPKPKNGFIVATVC